VGASPIFRVEGPGQKDGVAGICWRSIVNGDQGG